MPLDEPIPEDWLSFTCHFCRAKLKIRTKYAHLRGRCPDCGIRIEALRPRPYERRPEHSADEPGGLAPLGEEEWPEPALHDQPEPSYQLAPSPLTWPTEETPDPPAGGEVIAFELPPATATAAVTQPEKKEADAREEKSLYELKPAEPEPPTATPVAEFAPFQLSEAEKKPIRATPPPDRPFVQGIYNFPFRPNVLRVWILQGLGFAVLTFIPAVLRYVGEELGEGAFFMSAIFTGIGFLFVLMVTGSFGALYFIDVLEQTANGNEEIVWADNTWKEGSVALFRLGWVFLMTVLLPTFLLSVLGVNTLVAFLLVAPVLTPIGFLSLGTAPGWLGVSFEVVGRLSAKPRLFAALYVQTLPLWAVCAVAYYGVILWAPLGAACLLALPAGLLLSAGMLVYARLLGRVGQLLTQGQPKPKKRKRKKKPAAGSGADAVEQGESERPEDQDRQPGP